MLTKITSTLFVGSLAASMMLAGTAVQAADLKAGETKAMVCAACHGADGISLTPDVPNLAGQKEVYLAKAINYYKSGERKNPLMQSMVGALTDEDIANLAAYFASLK